MEHATSNANDADGHCRLPRKYMAARAANQRERKGEGSVRAYGGKREEKKNEPKGGRGRKEGNITTIATSTHCVYVTR